MITNKLTTRKVASLTKPGKYADGGGLYLQISTTPGGLSKRWVGNYTVGGKTRYPGFGAWPLVSLAQAREKAAEARGLVAKGTDPIAAKQASEAARMAAQAAEKARRTFGDVALELVAGKHRSWRANELQRHCALLWSMPVDSVDLESILDVLKALGRHPETASRVRGRIERVLDFAAVKGLRLGDNPARWRGYLEHVLTKPVSNNHHAALDYHALPDFVAGLRTNGAVAALCLEFSILCASRSGEARFAKWSEIDIEAKLWTIPGSRMKAGQEHRVPLSVRAVEILAELAEVRFGDFIFPGRVRKQPIGENAMAHLVEGVTVHGFRSSFRDWAGDSGVAREVAESALAHRVGNSVELAYHRSDALERRRPVMEAWSDFVGGRHADTNVVQLKMAAP